MHRIFILETYIRKKAHKSEVENLKYRFPLCVFLFRKEAFLGVEGDHLQCLPEDAVSFVTYLYFHGVTAKASTLSRVHDHPHAHHIRYDSSGRLISPTQRSVSQNLQQQSLATDIHDPVGFGPKIPARKRPQTNAVDLAVTEVGFII
jgi:hypothetical protein